MNDFEHDNELRDALRRAQPARNEASPILRANRARMVRARARRRAIVGSITAASLAVVGVAFFSANSVNDRTTVDVVSPPNTSVIVSSTAPDDSIDSSTSLVPPSTITTTPSAGQFPTTAPPTTAASTASTTTAQPSSTTAPTTTTTTTTTKRQTYGGRGGTITISWTTAISLEQITDAAGWSHTWQYKGDDVEVEWKRSNPDDDTKIRLRLDNGAISQEID
jgi:hypothetical protein